MNFCCFAIPIQRFWRVAEIACMKSAAIPEGIAALFVPEDTMVPLCLQDSFMRQNGDVYL